MNSILVLMLSWAPFALGAEPPPKPIVIAHRGASGYLPEHTLAAQAMAHAQGADYIEVDVVLTKDSIPIVLHDLYLDPTTNVETLFPQKKRGDGHWYALDLTLSEVKRLRVHERVEQEKPVFDKRFPHKLLLFDVPTLEESLLLLSSLNRSTGKNTGLYVELKANSFHRGTGRNLARIVYDTLTKHGLTTPGANLFIQSFEPDVLQYLRQDMKAKVNLIQLIGERTKSLPSVDFDRMLRKEGLRAIALYANGIGPSLKNLQFEPQLPIWAREEKLLVHPYTARTDMLPKEMASFDALLAELFTRHKVDGVFTDFPDLAVKYLQNAPKAKK